MPDKQDMELVREFARHNSEAAFAELVRRHINLVYSVALRCTGNSGDAEDVTQAVFIILARKAAGLREKTLLAGWLYETTRFTAARVLRTNIRRQHREQEAYVQSTLNETGFSQRSDADANVWQRLSPHLEAAMSKLGESDRALLVLRFYENKSGPEAAALLGIREGTAHKRAARAIEKLRKFFAKQGVSSTSAIIAGVISAHSVHTAPAALAKSVTVAAIAKGAAASGSILTLTKGVLKAMAWTKAKIAIIAGVSVLLATGTATVVIKRTIQPTIDDSFFKVDSTALAEAPPNILIIRPTHFAKEGSACMMSPDRGVGRNVRFQEMIIMAYESKYPRMVLPRNFPAGHFDYLATMPQDSHKQLQSEIERKFGLAGRKATLNTNVMLLRLSNPNAPQLRPTAGGEKGSASTTGRFSATNEPISELAQYVEAFSETPVVDETGLTNNYDLDLTWDESRRLPALDGLKQALSDQLGIEFIPGNAPVEMLVIEKAK